jgi:hypothetical protein
VTATDAAFKNVPYPSAFKEVMFQTRSGLDMYGPDPLNADPDPGKQINPILVRLCMSQKR